MAYNPAEIEPKWQAFWDETAAFRTEPDSEKPKYYVLDMFPYPSGSGLHVGHVEGYTASDIVARYRRMKGYEVLHPMGWDAFGLPAEQYALDQGVHPRVSTKANVDNFREQLKLIGFSYDWEREFSTTDPDYYRWTQWIFLKLHERGLSYLADVPVNWCPALGTVLANEEVKDGMYVETGDPVERRLMRQWMLRITEYAQRLLDDLDGLDWPESVKEMQRNWIGRSEGADITFDVEGTDESFVAFTTRPDTLFGSTWCVLAPEHPLVTKIATDDQRAAVEAYVAEASAKSDLDRTDLARTKSGVFTGRNAVHPVTGEPLPIWVADYVLMTYGTGAIMCVPGHDERDHEFATKFGLPIVEVISGGEVPVAEAAHTGDGTLVNSQFLDGLDVKSAITKMAAWLEENGRGKARVEYRLRDWLFSRQRYWGEPFPIVRTDDGDLVAVPEDQLPVALPPVDEYRPTDDGEPPLARAGEDWLRVTLPDGRTGTRETNTMPQWAGSCWYYLRFIDPKNDEAAWDRDLEKYWMPVDLYVGGVEHAVLHLLYVRFWHKVLFDCGLVSTDEPFPRLFNQGMVLAYSYKDRRGKYHHPHEAKEVDGNWVLAATGETLDVQIEKMGKSKLNVVTPDDVVRDYGADSMRLYELFMGPLEIQKPWQMSGVDGVHRFLKRTWRLVVNDRTGELSDRLTDAPGTSEDALWRTLHKTVKKVTGDTETLQMNTAVAQMMIFVNEATAAATLPVETVKIFLRTLSPYAPHLCEELWRRLGEDDLIAFADWPSYDEALCVEDEVLIAIQVNGKKRDEILVPKDATREDLEALALASEKAVASMGGKEPRKVIAVPGRLVNIVV